MNEVEVNQIVDNSIDQSFGHMDGAESSTVQREVDCATLQLFKEIFCNDRASTPFILKTSEGWRQVKSRWGDDLIRKHLRGEIVVGLFSPDLINHLIFDIDNHGENQELSVETRARAVMDLYDTEPLIYTSSDSGGFRICYFLDERYPKKQLYDSVKQKLTDAGLEVKSGVIEIMATRKGDRLPFGRGSYLVDPTTLKPNHHLELTEMVKYARDCSQLNRLSLPFISDIECQAGGIVKRSPFIVQVEDWDQNGLPKNESTNAVLLKLNWYLRAVCGKNGDEAERYLVSWVHEKHNGNSERINSGRMEEVEQQIERIVEAYAPHKVEYQGLRGLNKRLTVTDVEWITEMFHNYKHQLAVFSLLEYVKNRGSSIKPENKKDKLGVCLKKRFTSKSTSNYMSENQQIWECEIPSLAFKRFAGFNKATPLDTYNILAEEGIIVLQSRQNRRKHKCRSYLIFFDYDCDSEEVVSLDEGLRKLCSKKDLKKVYTRYRGDKILKGGCDE